MMLIDYYAHHNRFSRFHPVEKAWFAFSHLFLVLFLKHIFVSAFVFFLMGAVVVWGARIPWRRYLALLSLPFLFLILSILPLVFSIAPAGTEPAALIRSSSFGGWFVYISLSSVQQAAGLCSSAYAAVSCMYFFILTTPFHGIALTMNVLRVPPLFIDLAAVTYRFIFVFITKAEETYKAQKLRGGYSHWRSSLRSLSALTANLFVQTMREAKEVQMAVDARGGADAAGEQTHSYVLRPRIWGVTLLLFSLSCCIGVFF
ncbi:cobalt ECF transporter T component CbiQ [Bacillus sp. B190/17]|uniref:Cobalt ECF transporter T component CbiQ n=1 Tax=Bacillus lumedeiriae TaxID=3058829 RepID=A0ABW8I5X6_9BACI